MSRKCSVHILYTNPYQIHDLQIFSPTIYTIFSNSWRYCLNTNLFNLDQVHFICFFFFSVVSCAFGIVSKKHYLSWSNKHWLIYFLLRILYLYLSHIDGSFVLSLFLCILRGRSFSWLYSIWISNCPITIYLKDYTFPIEWSCHPSWNQLITWKALFLDSQFYCFETMCVCVCVCVCVYFFLCWYNTIWITIPL